MQNQPAWLQEDGGADMAGPANGDAAAASPEPQPGHERQVRARTQIQRLCLSALPYPHLLAEVVGSRV